MSTWSSPAVNRPGRGVDNPLSSGARLKKEYSCTFIPLWAFVACS